MWGVSILKTLSCSNFPGKADKGVSGVSSDNRVVQRYTCGESKQEGRGGENRSRDSLRTHTVTSGPVGVTSDKRWNQGGTWKLGPREP